MPRITLNWLKKAYDTRPKECSGPLERMVYLSEATIPGDPHSVATTLEGVVAHSRDYNEGLNVTGLLLFSGDHFIQAIEGPASSVRHLWKHIGKDDRHSGCRILIKDSNITRIFADWAMAFAIVDLQADDPVDALLTRLHITPGNIRARQLTELMALHLKYAELPAELELAR